MARKYTAGELQEMLAGLQRHPEDERIVYAPEDRDLIIPLIREGFIDAAIIPAEDGEAFGALTWQAQEYESPDYDEGTIAQQFFVRDDNLFFYEGGRRLTNADKAALPAVVRESFGRLSQFIYPHETWTPAKPARQLANQLSELFWEYKPDDVEESRIVELAEWLDRKYPKRQTNLLVLWQESGTGERGPMPNLHHDAGLSAHISGHNPMEFMVGRLTGEQWDIIRKSRTAERDELLAQYPELKSRIRKLNPGDMIVFGPNFVHRSAEDVGEKGQLNIAAEPATSWPYDIV
ncbi:MAG: hypothetical protein KDI65_09745 [Alphaproteobacteria bacterium]|nr:hypothetical protein [Alphaproteobacteria bacterium]